MDLFKNINLSRNQKIGIAVFCCILIGLAIWYFTSSSKDSSSSSSSSSTSNWKKYKDLGVSLNNLTTSKVKPHSGNLKVDGNGAIQKATVKQCKEVCVKIGAECKGIEYNRASKYCFFSSKSKAEGETPNADKSQDWQNDPGNTFYEKP